MGDRLIAVDGWPCYGQSTKDVTDKIRGMIGSMVTLSTQKANGEMVSISTEENMK